MYIYIYIYIIFHEWATTIGQLENIILPGIETRDLHADRLSDNSTELFKLNEITEKSEVIQI